MRRKGRWRRRRLDKRKRWRGGRDDEKNDAVTRKPLDKNKGDEQDEDEKERRLGGKVIG